jgi:predicted membrane protein
MMSWTQRLVLLALALGMLGLTLELREEYAVLWVCTGIMILVFVVMPNLLFILSGWLQLDRTVLMTFVCFLFLAAIVMHYSVVISKHSEREKNLTQEVALLRDELEKLRAEAREAPPTPAEPKPRPPALRT